MKFEQAFANAAPKKEIPLPENSVPPEEESFERKRARKYWRVERLEVNGREVELIGVAHEPATLEIPEYRAKIESAIKNASLSVLENGPLMFQFYSYENFRDAIRSYVPDFSEEDVQRAYIIGTVGPMKQFFHAVLNMAAEARTDIMSADPNEDLYKVMRLEFQDKKTEEAKEATFIGALATFFGSAAALSVQEALKRRRKKESPPKVAGMSRRTFLKAAGAGALVAGLSKASTLASENTENYLDREENPLGFALYNIVDYRDATIAEAIDTLSKETAKPGPIEVIHGTKHVAGIKRYLENPAERKARLLAYAPFAGSPEEIMKVFAYDGKEWKQRGNNAP